MDELELLLKNFDWWYSYSDDHSVFMKFHNQWMRISELAKGLREEGRGAEVDNLFKRFSPEELD